jgi:uncharacterized protein
MLKRAILQVLERYPDIKLCVLFGSAAKGRLRAESDVDVAVAAVRALSIAEKLALLGDLALATGRGVDVVDLRQAGGYVLQQALTTGVVILKTDKQLYAAVLKRMLFNQADMMPLYSMILEKRRERFLHG